MSETVTPAGGAPWFYRKRFTVFGLCYGAAPCEFGPRATWPLPWKIAPGAGQRGSLADGLRAEIPTAVLAAGAIIITALRWPR